MEVVKGKIDTDEIKRCYIHGAVLERDCPKCGKKLVNDLGIDYLSYPVEGGTKHIYFYCEDCDIEYTLPVIFNCEVTLTVKGELEKN